jgi:alkanesulfonate monooxygenase SsuD/methylene tetrahydromethanopterin reductase-like flavin-dependent oxidoreductase (luciferase family)
MIGEPGWTPAERVAHFGEYVELVGQLLTGEVTTFAGRHYRAEGAVLPRPAQSPRPPLLIAALGPRMLRLAARHADIWNSLSFLPTFPEQLAATRARIERVDSECAAIGRDPTTLRRSYTLFDAQARARGGAMDYYASAERLVERVEQLVALGISDIGLYYPLDQAQCEPFERIASDTLPHLRAAYYSV